MNALTPHYRATLRDGNHARRGMVKERAHGVITFREDGKRVDRVFMEKWWAVEPESQDSHA